MNQYHAIEWLLDLFNIMGATLQGLFVMPVFTFDDVTVNIGQLLVFDFIVTILLKFALNLPTSGITINERIKKKNEA